MKEIHIFRKFYNMVRWKFTMINKRCNCRKYINESSIVIDILYITKRKYSEPWKAKIKKVVEKVGL
jgi:hypothetical protein